MSRVFGDEENIVHVDKPPELRKSHTHADEALTAG
jgi:hypothetical protein